jgi:hypothetical protein
MAGGTWQLTNTTRIKFLNGQFDLDSDNYKCALVTSASNISATSTTWAGVTGEVGTSNTGYTTGGITVSPLVLSGTTSVTVKFGTNPVWTAGSANLTAKTAVLYEVGGDVVGFCNLDSGGADVTATSGNTMTADAITNPIFTLA